VKSNHSKQALVSVVVPVFNGERYLCESLDSILAQTYPHLEILVMDDASTDRTPEIIASYGGRVQHHRQPQNRGIYANANDGIARARGDYVAVYHADDIYEPAIVEREVRFLERYPEAGAVFCSDIFIDPEGREEGRLRLPPEVRGGRPLPYAVVFNALLKYRNPFLRCPSSMVRASVYRDVGVYRQERFRNTSDIDMWLRIGQKYPMGILEEHLFRYRYGHGNSAQRYHATRTDMERFFVIMDLYLNEGGHRLAQAAALREYEAHRAQDALLCTINAYLQGRMDTARAALRRARIANLIRGTVVERWRLLALWCGLHVLVRLPRLSPAARLMSWRWRGRGRRKRGTMGPPAGEPSPPPNIEQNLAL